MVLIQMVAMQNHCWEVQFEALGRTYLCLSLLVWDSKAEAESSHFCLSMGLSFCRLLRTLFVFFFVALSSNWSAGCCLFFVLFLFYLFPCLLSGFTRIGSIMNFIPIKREKFHVILLCYMQEEALRLLCIFISFFPVSVSRHYDSVSFLFFIAEPVTSLLYCHYILPVTNHVDIWYVMASKERKKKFQSQVHFEATFDTWIVWIFVMIDFKISCNGNFFY